MSNVTGSGLGGPCIGVGCPEDDSGTGKSSGKPIQSGYRHKDGPIRYKGLKRTRKAKENQGKPTKTNENQGQPKIIRYPSETWYVLITVARLYCYWGFIIFLPQPL